MLVCLIATLITCSVANAFCSSPASASASTSSLAPYELAIEQEEDPYSV